ncbi:MAG: hypothetical protein IT431_07125 [Phycisphaerales bacterium]|nr:hypothetical protein [Phycisphaerales bacterium]
MSEPPPAQVRLECKREGRGGKFAVVLTLPESDSIVRYFVLADPAEREAFADEIAEAHSGIARGDLLKTLENEAARQLGAEDTASAGSSLADRLVALVQSSRGIELFHCPEGEAYAMIPVGDHRETWRIMSRGFRDWLSNESLTHLEKVPGSQALQDALGALSGRAKFQGSEHAVHVRVAAFDGSVWVDLCDRDWQAVQVNSEAWRVVPAAEVPVKFIRRKGMLPLPQPVHGGSVEDLRRLVNMPDDDTWTLAVGWMVGALRPSGPYGVLSVSGEAGSAKSTACRLIRGLIDPNLSPLRRMPKSERDIFISAGNSWISSYNNMSGVRPELSDALCALATDGGFATRQLYADDEEAIFSARRPAVLNGIDDPATKSDLRDRCIALSLRRIAEEGRLTEEHVNAEYERVRPGVLGALLDAVSRALRNAPGVSLPSLPRMADLTLWVTAAEEALGWEAGRFYRAFTGNQASSHAESVDASPIGPPILALVEGGPFEGTATELLGVLNHRRGDDPIPEGWPKSYSGMSSQLKRLSQDLRGVGLEVHIPTKGSGREKKRLIRLAKVGDQRAAGAARTEDDAEDADRSRCVEGETRRVEDGEPEAARRSDCDWVQPDAVPDTDADRAARAARPIRTQSNRGDDPWRQ